MLNVNVNVNVAGGVGGGGGQRVTPPSQYSQSHLGPSPVRSLFAGMCHVGPTYGLVLTGPRTYATRRGGG